MFQINPNTLYSKSDLLKAFEGVADLNRLLDRLRPKSVVMGMYLGADIIDAIKRAPDYREIQYASALEREAKAKLSPKKGRKQKAPHPPDLISKNDELA